MNNEDSKIEKIKELYNKYKEAKKDPRKKAGMKLLGYFVFFFILFLIAGISSHFQSYDNSNSVNKTITTTTLIDKYNDKQKDLLTNKYNISYVINVNSVEYKINGTLENNIVNGYLELSDSIKKIVIKENEIFEIDNNEEKVLEIELNKDFINLEHVINLIKQNRAIISESDNFKTYSYDIKDIGKVIVATNEESITEIKIENATSNYLLSFDK